MIADARSKLENEVVLAMPSVLMEDGRGRQCSCSTVIEAKPDSSDSVYRRIKKEEAKTRNLHHQIKGHV